MSVDKLQEKIRKTKNPAVLELNLTPELLPPHILSEEGSFHGAYGRFCTELLSGLKGLVPGVRFSWAHFALLNATDLLQEYLAYASQMGYYTILDAPESLSPAAAQQIAAIVQNMPCDGILVSSYLGSDGVKPYVKGMKDSKKALFVVIRTGNKSATELQDLMTGSRLVHMAVADMVNHLGEALPGRSGYNQVAGLAAASSASSLKTLRSKYPKVFFLLDGYDYPNANAKNCSFAFDKLGHGAAACASTSILCAWKEAGTDGKDYVDQAVQAAKRMQTNLTRYIAIL